MGKTGKTAKSIETSPLIPLSKHSKSIKKGKSGKESLPLELTEENVLSVSKTCEEPEKSKRGRKSYNTIVNELKQLKSENTRLEDEVAELKKVPHENKEVMLNIKIS